MMVYSILQFRMDLGNLPAPAHRAEAQQLALLNVIPRFRGFIEPPNGLFRRLDAEMSLS